MDSVSFLCHLISRIWQEGSDAKKRLLEAFGLARVGSGTSSSGQKRMCVVVSQWHDAFLLLYVSFKLMMSASSRV